MDSKEEYPSLYKIAVREGISLTNPKSIAQCGEWYIGAVSKLITRHGLSRLFGASEQTKRDVKRDFQRESRVLLARKLSCGDLNLFEKYMDHPDSIEGQIGRIVHIDTDVPDILEMIGVATLDGAKEYHDSVPNQIQGFNHKRFREYNAILGSLQEAEQKYQLWQIKK